MTGSHKQKKAGITGVASVKNDGSHIIFVNGQYVDNESDIGKLMHDFRCTQADDMYYDVLAKSVRYFKETERGNGTMCKMMEDMRNEAAVKSAYEKAVEITTSLLDSKLSIEEIAKHSGLSVDEVKEIAEKKKA